MIRANRASNLVALVLAASLLFPTSALAVNRPYIDDVNEWGAKSSIVTVCAHGKEKSCQWRVTDLKTGKRAKVENVHKYKSWHVGTVILKHKHVYKVSVRAKSHGKWGKWKSIAYGVYNAY